LTQNAGTDVTADLEEENHASEHNNNGADEINLTGLSGETADPQTVTISTGGTVVAISSGINIVAGSNVTVSATTSAGRVNITIASTGGGGGGGPKEYWWPAAATLALQVSDSIATVGKSTGTNVDQFPVDFDPNTDECRTVNFKVPSNVNTSGTVTFRTHWFSTGTATNNVIWDFRHNGGVSEGATPDAALTTKAASADAAQATAGQLTVTTWTETISTLGWAANEQVDAEFCRDANNGSDTLATDARAVGFGVDIPRS
jgi:hypothetical protein